MAHTTRLVWTGRVPLEALLAEEWDLGVFDAPQSVWIEGGGRRISLHEPGNLPLAARLDVVEGHSGLRVVLFPSAPARVWGLPLFTISNSEGGYEKNYQGAMVLLRWPVTLAPGERWEQTTRCEIEGGI